MKDAPLQFDEALGAMPLIAILRGLRPEEAEAVAGAIFHAGIGIIEVPLNSPSAFVSIETIAKAVGEKALVGAGTVLTRLDAVRAREAGARLIVSPNMNPDVIAASVELKLASLPGIMTPTEAFGALAAGATALKIFPGELATPASIKALAAVLPDRTRLILVGGVTTETPAAYADAPVAGYGIGSSLYKPGLDAKSVGERAARLVAAMRSLGQRS